MSVARVKQFLAERKCDLKVLALDRSTATVAEAAAAFGVAPGRIAKTLAIRRADGVVVIVVTAGDVRLDNKKCKIFFGGKIKMLDQSEVEAVTGHPVGGVCPFGLKADFPIYLDETLKAFDTVYPAAGATNAAVCMPPQTLQTLVGAQWADLTRT